ncbi:outer membrane beta-barrel protein [Algoriphagus boritolerans]|uniref:outer membrane beta-barrel protein n=1 Tax=Algoriphagus boritolerans TaxID=308111 RepID=UPI000B2A35F1
MTENFRNNDLISNRLRNTDTKDLSNSVDVSLNYTRSFEKKGRELSLLTLYSRNNRENSFINTLFTEDFSTIDSRLKNDNPSRNEEFTVQLDYVTPLDEKGNQILEYGAKKYIEKSVF